MLTNLVFNLVLLLLSDSVFVIGAANIGYLIFNFLNLNAGWIHRCDRPVRSGPGGHRRGYWPPERCCRSSISPSWIRADVYGSAP